MIRTLARDALDGLGAFGLAVSAVVIAVAAIGERFGKDHDRRDGTGSER
jgi:hypothetical protein